MVVFDYIKKPLALLLSLLIIISAVPVMVLFAGDSENNNYIEVYDPFGELRPLTSASPNLDTSCPVDFSGSNFSIIGTYDGVKNAELNSGFNDSEFSIFTASNLAMHNISFRVGGWYNALHARQAYNGHRGNMVQLIFTAPYAGKYKLIPEGISRAGNKSMLLTSDGTPSVPENCTQTFSVIKGTETVWSKTLTLSAQNPTSVTDDIDPNIEVELAKNEKLIFEFKAPKEWIKCDLYANFDIALTEYIFNEISGVYFPQENYLVEKNGTLDLNPVIVPSTVANSNVFYTVSDTNVLSVDANGKVTPKAEGYSIVTVTTEDGGFTDTATIAVYDSSAPSYSAKSLYDSAVNKLGSLDSVKTVDNDIALPWNTLYKTDNGYVKHEKLSYTDWNELAFHAADKDYHGNASTVAVSSNALALYYGRQDTIPHGTAIEFTAPEYGIYALTSDGNNNSVSLLPLTLNYIGSNSTTKFDVNFYLNDEIIKTVELSATHTSEDFPVLNFLELQKDDKVRIELVTSCWERGGIAIAPKMIRIFDELKESPVTDITLSDTEITLSKNGTKTIFATVSPVFADDKSLSFLSTDTAVATVDETGLITAVGVGEAIIKVNSKKYPTVGAECKVTIEGPKFSSHSAIKDAGAVASTANTMYDAKFDGLFSAGILADGEYSDFKYVVNPWGSSKYFTNNIQDTAGNKSSQFVELYSQNFIQIGSLVANSWVYTGFTADADGLYTLKPNDNFKDIKLCYTNGANSADNLIDWGEDHPVYVRITKNGEKIWPSGDTAGYELKPSGNQSVEMPELKDLELYKGDIIRVEILGQNKVARHMMVHYNYDVAMTKSVNPAVKVDGINLDNTVCELIVDETAKLTATVTPDNATNKNVIYVSSDSSVASVTAGGVITALKQGTATIYAISGDNDDIKSACTVTVLPKGPSYNVVSSLKESSSNVTEPNVPFNAQFSGFISAGILSDGEYTDFKYVINQWGQYHKAFTNNKEDLVGVKSSQIVEFYNDNFVQTSSWIADSWVYTGFTVNEDGMYTFKPNSALKNIELVYANGATNAQTLIDWNEDHPLYVRITKNGEKIWPAGDTVGYELKPSGNNSVAMPEIKDMELYKGDVIRVEVLGQNKVGRHLQLKYNFDINMRKTITPAVKAEGISLDKTSHEIYTGDTVKLNATVTPDNTTNKNVRYESSDSSIVSVTAGGVVTALKTGNAKIYVISCDNESVKTSCDIEVIQKGPTYNIITSLKETAENVKEPNKVYDAEFNAQTSAGVLKNNEYTDFKYVVNQWGGTQKQFTNLPNDTDGSKSQQYVEVYNNKYTSTGSFVADSWVYTAFTVDADGIYNFKPNKDFKNIELGYINGANSANALISWGEDYPVYVRITKNGEKIWPAGNTQGYELKPGGNNSVLMPELKDLALYKGDVIRVEVSGQSKVNRHMEVRYNYDIEMMKAITPAVKVNGIKFDKTSHEIYTGDSVKVAASVTPANATNKNVRYESSDKSVLSVTASGVVTALKEGSATVYAISCDNNDIKDSCLIKVIAKGASHNVATSLNESASVVKDANTIYDAKFEGPISTGVLSDGEYNDFKYVVNQWGQSQKLFTNVKEDLAGGKSNQFAEIYSVNFVQIGSWVADSWVYTGYTVEADGIYNFKPNQEFKNIELAYLNGANNAQALIDWGEDHPVYVRITKNGEKIWPAGDTKGYELKPSGNQSVAMPELNNLELYKGDTIRVEISGQNKVGRHLLVRYNYDIDMLKAVTPAVKVTGVSLDKTSETLYTGDTLKLTAKVTPSNATNKNVYYESSNPEIVSVTRSGVVTALKQGKATVYAISYDKNSVKASCTITIKQKGSSHNMATSLRELFKIIKEPKTMYDAKFEKPISAGVLSAGEYTDFKYAVNQWGTSQVAFTNEFEDLEGTKSKQYAEVYNNEFVQIGSLVDNSWVYTAYSVEADGIYNFKPDKKFKDIELYYANGANTAQAMIDWGEDYPVYVRITKNGEKIWPAGDTQGYELKPSGNQSVAMPEFSGLELYKGDVIRVEVLGQGKVGRHMLVRYNYNVEMLDPITPAVRAKGISLDKKSYELSIGQSVKLTATVTPKNATNKNVRYESSDPAVVSVSQSGVVTTLKQGKATVYAISCDDSNVKTSCDITVTSFKIIEYSPLDLFPSIERQLNGKISVTNLPVEFDTNWSAQGLNSKGNWEDAYNLTTYDWNNDKVIDCREFGYGWKNAVGIEGKQPFMLSETGTVSMLFTASRAGTYKLSPDPAKSMISIPGTFLTSRVPVKDRDKVWTFKIYNNDKELFSTDLSCKGVNAVEFPTIDDIYMMTGDNIRFVLENCEEAESQIDIWFSPIISLITPDKKEYPPTGTDREYMLQPNTSIEGKIKAVHPNGLDIYFKDISPKSANSLVIGADGSFTYTPKKDYKGIDEREIRLSDERGNTSVVKLKFIVCLTYDGAQMIRDKLLSFDPKATGVVQNMTFDDAIWRFQYTYDALTYPNGSPKYYDTDLAECIENPGWKGYTAYANGMPQATIHYSGTIPIIDIMAGEKPWNTSPVGSATFVAPSDGTYLLRGNDKYNKFLATNSGEKGISQPIKVWISKNGQKIWPVNQSAVELTKENPEIEFPELKIAMKTGDTVKICVSGHPVNGRKNTVGIAPMMYDIGAYNVKLDPVTEPEGGVVIVDDDGEPRVRYTNFSLRKSKKSVSDDPFIEPIIDKNYTLNKITKLKKLEAFKMSATYKECVGVDNYLVNVYRETEYGYELFAEQSTKELTVELSDFIEGKYAIQVLALDKRGQYIEIYTARNFAVNKNGNFKFGGFGIVTLIIILGSVTMLAVLAGGYVFIIRKRRK